MTGSRGSDLLVAAAHTCKFIMRLAYFVPALLAISVAFTCSTTDAQTQEQSISEVYQADQRDRSTKNPHTGAREINWPVVQMRDEERRRQVKELIRESKLITADDFYDASIIFQHGDSVEDIKMAYSLANIATAINPELPNARFMTAASWDRILVKEKLPQWYGTQFTKNETTGRWELSKTDATIISDEERRALRLPTLNEAQAYADELNARDHPKK